jgi:hypothetical protein
MINSWLSGLEQRRNEKKLHRMFPLVAAWTVRPSDSGGDLHLFTLSVKNAGNRLVLADWLLGLSLSLSGEVGQVEHAGERIYRFPLDHGRSMAFFIRGNDLFFASDIGTAEEAVDRLTSPVAAAPAPEDLRRLYDRLPADAPLRGAVSNADGELDRLWDRLVGGPPPDHPLGAGLAGGLADADTIRIAVQVLYPDGDDARAAAPALAQSLRQTLAVLDLDVSAEPAVEGDRARIDLEVGGIERALQQTVRFPDRRR